MEEDRISQLPDAILHVILSSLDINDAVRTSILSKRWRHLPSSMSELNFNYYRLARHSHVNLQNPHHCLHFTTRFTQSVTHFLSHRCHSFAVTKFRLSLHCQLTSRVQDPTFIARCVDYAVTHGVENLDIHQLFPRPTRFPDAFFSCKTLRQLTLRRFGSFLLPRKFSLPNLSTLYVESSGFAYDDDEFYGAKEPFAGFPNLEKLSLRNTNVLGLIIVAPKLSILEVIFDEKYIVLHCTEIERISTPALKSLRYQGVFPLECLEAEIPVLEEAYLECSRKFTRQYQAYQVGDVPLKCVRMLQQFGNAKVVTLALSTLEVLEMDVGLLERSLSPFPHINCLKLTKGRGMDYSMKMVPPAVMNYLTMSDDSLAVEFPEYVCVVEDRVGENLVDEEDSGETQLEWLWEE